MYCKKCGVEIADDKVLCSQCENVESILLNTESQGKNVEVKSKKMGLLSVIFGFASLFIPLLNKVTAVLAIVFGIKAKNTKGEDLGYIGIIAGCTYFVSLILASAFAIIIYGLYFVLFLVVSLAQ